MTGSRGLTRFGDTVVRLLVSQALVRIDAGHPADARLGGLGYHDDGRERWQVLPAQS
jgi:hypothetical protein